jgi:hypothetical protein
MANSIVGIQVDIRENASSVAPRIAEQLSHIGDAGEEAGERLNAAFDTTKIESQFDKFAEKMDKVFGKERELRIKNLELRNQTMEKRLEGGSGTGASGSKADASRPGNLVRGVGGAVAGVGDTGNPIPAAGGIMDNISGMISKAGPVGMIIGGIVSLFSAVGIVIDALSKQYEAFIPSVMDATAAFGDLKSSVTQNTVTFKQSLKAAADSASKFGYTIEQGMSVRLALAKGGLSSGVASGLSDSVFGYARGYGVGPESLTGAAVLGSRHKQGNVLGMAAGGVASSGMGAGRYDEYLQAMAGTFEAALSKGIVKGFGEISSTMNFFSRLGETWKGSLGAQRINQMSSAFEGSTSLQKETDVLMYRAASALVTKETGGKGSYLDTMKKLEGGMSPELFKAFGSQLKEMTGGNQFDMVEMMRESMGVNYTTAMDLVKSLDDLGKMSDEQIKALLKTTEAPSAGSVEMQLIQAENELRMKVIELGETVIATKKDLVKGMADVVRGLGDFVGAGDAKKKEELEAARERGTGIGEAMRAIITPGLEKKKYEDLLALKDSLSYARPGEKGDDALMRGAKYSALSTALTGLTPDQIKKLEETGGMTKLSSKLVTDSSGIPTMDSIKEMIKALKELTVTMKTPASITVEAPRSPKGGGK